MVHTVETLLRENMHGVFGEPDAEKRREKIASIWAEDGVFIDPEGRSEGRSAVDRAAAAVLGRFPGFKFTERGLVQASIGVGRLEWAFGPAGGEAVLTGTDVLVMKGDLIGAVYTFVDPPKE